MATENCENFPCRSGEKAENSSKNWREIDRRLRNIDISTCFSMPRRGKLSFPCIFVSARVHDSCGVATFSAVFSEKSRDRQLSLASLSAFSLSFSRLHSRENCPNRIGLDKRDFALGARGILYRATSKHVDFSPKLSASGWQKFAQKGLSVGIFSQFPREIFRFPRFWGGRNGEGCQRADEKNARGATHQQLISHATSGTTKQQVVRHPLTRRSRPRGDSKIS